MSSHLRLECDVETTLTGDDIAAVLRGVVQDYGRDYSPEAVAMLNELADAIEKGHRAAPEGTRGTLRMDPRGNPYTREGAANLADLIVEQTRRLTINPGDLVEFQISVVVASKIAEPRLGADGEG